MTGSSAASFDMPWMFHPTHIVADLEEAAEWFRKVFGRGKVTWGERWDLSKLSPDYPVDYSFWVLIGDVVHDVLCPSLYRVDSDAVPYGVGSGLSGISWWVEDSTNFATAMEKKGITLIDQAGRRVAGGQFARSLLTDEFTLMSMITKEAGFPHTFSEILGASRQGFAKVDKRLAGGWTLPAPSPDDLLCITGCAWHTLASDDVERAVGLFTKTLGGRLIGAGKDVVGGQTAQYVEFARCVLEFLPQRTPLKPNETGRQDAYDSITLRVTDIKRARQHLQDCGIRLSFDSESLIRTDPTDCLGATWGFTTDLAPGDDRRNSEMWRNL